MAVRLLPLFYLVLFLLCAWYTFFCYVRGTHLCYVRGTHFCYVRGTHFCMCVVLFFAMCMVHISPGFPNKAFPMHETKNNCAGDEKSLLRVCTEPIFHRGSPPSFVYSS